MSPIFKIEVFDQETIEEEKKQLLDLNPLNLTKQINQIFEMIISQKNKEITDKIEKIDFSHNISLTDKMHQINLNSSNNTTILQTNVNINNSTVDEPNEYEKLLIIAEAENRNHISVRI